MTTLPALSAPAGGARSLPHAPGPGAPAPPPGAASCAASCAPAGFGGGFLYALLVALAALAALKLSRLCLESVRWRSAAVVALIERPG
jgi:hypothetical protein